MSPTSAKDVATGAGVALLLAATGAAEGVAVAAGSGVGGNTCANVGAF